MSSAVDICQEVQFAQLLASNQPRICNKALRKVEKWLQSHSYSDEGFSEDSMLKLWKGLYYYFWNLDKPLVQENLADKISKFVHIFKKQKVTFLFIDAFFQTMSREWFAVDRYRIEKFMMFCRRFLQECFILLKNLEWEISAIKDFRNIMKSTLNRTSGPCSSGLKFHITDIFMEELARVGSETLSAEQLKSFLVPFCSILRDSIDVMLLRSIEKEIFMYLLHQDADANQFESYPMLKFDCGVIAELLQKHKNKGCIKKKNERIMDSIIHMFQTYTTDPVPEVKENAKPGPAIRKRAIQKAAESLMAEHESFAAEKRTWKKRKTA